MKESRPSLAERTGVHFFEADCQQRPRCSGIQMMASAVWKQFGILCVPVGKSSALTGFIKKRFSWNITHQRSLLWGGILI